MRNHELKLNRAWEHFQSLEAQVHRWIEEDPHELIDEFEPQTGKRVIKIRILNPPPAEFAPIIGDCLYNFRSGLDHLIYELVVAYHGDPPPSQFVESSE